MKKEIIALLFLLLSVFSRGQTLRLHGNISDTTSSQSLANVVLMAVKFSDSTLVSFTRSNSSGIFKPIIIPKDTYLVILSHPAFSDKTYLLVPSEKDTAFHFKNVVLPPKSVELKEVEVFAYREKSYYKGDTLIFTADSFKTHANATVEDLLKKLPGFRVDAAGKITVQGKEVDQVLVDGDEFFGADPTIATRNLNATGIANVQIYDKKNESTEEGKGETLKVLNLQMKDDAKKGYFGKASAAGDLNKFYETELLLNRFRGNRKMSVFGLIGNTPKQAFGGGDVYKYGLNGEQEWQYDPETGSWNNNRNSGTGIPQTIKTGFYFNDKISKKTKINSDYTYNQKNLWQGSQTNTQFFLQDTTYSNLKVKSNNSRGETHNFNFTLVQKLDSLTELVVAPKIKYSTSGNNNVQTDEFYTEKNDLTRKTVLNNRSDGENADATMQVKITRNFMKKDRTLVLNYLPSYNRSVSHSLLNTDFLYYLENLPDSSLVQKRNQSNEKMEHNITATYTEPLTKKFKTELSYSHIQNELTSNRNTFDLATTGYDLFNPDFSNSFRNKRIISRAGTKLIYEVKKYRISFGSNFRNIEQENINLTNNKRLHQQVQNILPMASFNYRISQGSNLGINYFTNSQQPELQQMQPVIDNTDPNRLAIGNPDLRPTFSNNLSFNYYFYKGISDVNFYSHANFNNTQGQISNTTTFDSLGRAVTQPVNVEGNYSGNMNIGGGFPVLKKFLKIYYGIEASHSNNISFINGAKNITKNTSVGPSLNLQKDEEKFDINIGAGYDYYIPESTISLQSSQPYYTYDLSGDVNVKLPGRFFIATDGKYTNNGNRTPGYNLNYFIWNASAGRAFLKTENLILSLNAFDILNQNISNERTVNSNQITDTKTQIIKRYFLLKLYYKFNNQKTKVEEDDNY